MSDVAARLNRLPATRIHRHATIIAGIGSFFDLFDIFLAGVLGTVLTREFHLDRVSLPAALGSAFVGMFIGAVLLGRFADRFGRRNAFLLNLAIYSVFTLLGAFSTSAAMLIASRFAAGIGIGAELPLVDVYLSEILPVRLRGRYTAWAYTLGFTGIPAAGLLGRFLVPREPFGVDGWRWLFVAGSLGAVIVWFVRTQLPESPRWLASVGRVDAANTIVERMEREALDLGPLLEPARDLPDSGERAGPRALFREPYRQRAIMLSVFHVFQTVGYYGFGTLVPIVLASKGYSIVSSLGFTALTFVGYPIGSALSVPLIERIDRRWIIIGAAFLMSVFGLAFGYASSAGAIVLFGFLYTTVSNVFSNGLHTFQAEIFPTFIRATAAGTCYGFSRLSSAVMPFVLLPVLDRWGAGAMFGIIAAALWIVMIDIALFAPSTTGRALEEVNVTQ